MLGPNKNLFLYWTGTGNQFCIEPNGSSSWWGPQRKDVQFNIFGQMLSKDCIGKFGIGRVMLINRLHRDKDIVRRHFREV